PLREEDLQVGVIRSALGGLFDRGLGAFGILVSQGPRHAEKRWDPARVETERLLEILNRISRPVAKKKHRAARRLDVRAWRRGSLGVGVSRELVFADALGGARQPVVVVRAAELAHGCERIETSGRL